MTARDAMAHTVAYNRCVIWQAGDAHAGKPSISLAETRAGGVQPYGQHHAGRDQHTAGVAHNEANHARRPCTTTNTTLVGSGAQNNAGGSGTSNACACVALRNGPKGRRASQRRNTHNVVALKSVPRE